MAWGKHKDDKRPGPDQGGGGGGGPAPEVGRPEFAPESPGGLDAGLDGAQQQIARLLAERDDLNQKYLRTLADYQNSQRRAVANEREAKQQGVTSVVLNALTVLDHFDLALGQDPSKATADSIVKGVKVIRDELMRVLHNHGVRVIEAARNGEFDPSIHQAVMQTESEDVEPGHIDATLQPGYMLGERIIRPATVTIRRKADDEPGDER